MDDGLGRHWKMTCENPECGQVITGRRDYMYLKGELIYAPPTHVMCPCGEGNSGTKMRIEEVTPN